MAVAVSSKDFIPFRLQRQAWWSKAALADLLQVARYLEVFSSVITQYGEAVYIHKSSS